MKIKPRATLAQSAALPYRHGRYGPEVLLVTSRTTRRWVVPKGTIEPRLTPALSAAAEAFEEAGIQGPVSSTCIGTYGYEKAVSSRVVYCSVRVYPMTVTAELDDWPEKAQRRREWMPFPAAARGVHEPGLRRILMAFRARLDAEAAAADVTGL